MQEALAALRSWQLGGRRGALARVVGVVGSSPRAAGAAMAVRDDGEVVGSLSGGCVESAVVTEALAACARGTAVRRSFGYSDDEAFAVGLTCGGTLEVFVEPFSWPRAATDAVLAALGRGEAAGVATVLGASAPAAARPSDTLVVVDETAQGSLGDSDLDRVVRRDLDALAGSANGAAIRHYGAHGEALREEVTVFLQGFAPARRLVIFGAMDFTAALVSHAKLLGYRVTVCDARASFATAARFPDADEIVVEWPDRHLAAIGSSLSPRDAICVLTHDPKFDVPALRAGLSTAVGYLGAMGSRRTVEDRRARLLEAGIDAESLARIRMPIGLDLGARTPAETAVSICAEMILCSYARGGALPLSAGSGPIHPEN